jgi:hypothetical protein
MKYDPQIVTAYMLDQGIPAPIYEYKFHPVRRWRFDLCWLPQRVALEVQGGIFVRGRHSRGAALLKEWEKLNTAAGMGWRVLYCQPRDLCTLETADFIRNALQCDMGAV